MAFPVDEGRLGGSLEAGVRVVARTDIASIRIAPTGVTGGLEVDVSLANWYEPTNNCRVQFETDYPSISRFREQIERMMEARIGDAVLYGSTWVR